MVGKPWRTILVLAMVVTGCQPTGEPAPPAAEWTDGDWSAITALSDRYLQALVDDDVDALASLFVEDGIRLVNGGAVTHGRAAIQAIGSLTPVGNPAGDFVSLRANNVTIGGEGDLAYSWLDYDLTVVLSVGAEPSNYYGRFLNVIRRQPDGTWLFVAVMFNTRPSP